MKVVVFILGLLISVVGSAQQGGFLNKKHEVSFDVLSPLLLGEYSLNYKYSPKYDFAMVAYYKGFSKTFDFTQEDFEKSEYNIGTVGGDVSSFTIEDLGYDKNIIIGESKVSGSSWGINFLGSKSGKGLPLPMGYYLGYGYERASFKQSDVIIATPNPIFEDFSNYSFSVPYNPYLTTADGISSYRINEYSYVPVVTEYENTSNFIKIIWGKDSYLGKNITLDATVEFGIRWGTITSSNLASSNKKAIRALPYRNELSWEFLSETEFEENPSLYNSYNFGSSQLDLRNIKAETSYVQFVFFSPKLKIGYLF